MAERAAPLRKLDLTIARLRLLLADVGAREAALEDQRRTCLDQRDKLITFSLYGDTTLDSVLTMLADVEERLMAVESRARALRLIRERAARELESLQLTKGVEEAKVLLSELQARQAESLLGGGAPSAAEIQAEISRLQALINEASERAAQNAMAEKAARRAERSPGTR
jgi:hypothetical protein